MSTPFEAHLYCVTPKETVWYLGCEENTIPHTKQEIVNDQAGDFKDDLFELAEAFLSFNSLIPFVKTEDTIYRTFFGTDATTGVLMIFCWFGCSIPKQLCYPYEKDNRRKVDSLK